MTLVRRNGPPHPPLLLTKEASRLSGVIWFRTPETDLKLAVHIG